MALLYGLPVMLAMGIASLPVAPFVVGIGFVGLLGSVWAMVEFWRLAWKTATDSPYEFTARFWTAAVGAAVGLLSFQGVPHEALLLLVGMPSAAVAHFSILQFKRGRSRHTRL